MRKSMFVIGLFAAFTGPLAARAQRPAPMDSAQQERMRVAAMQPNRPAAFMLQHRADLELTPTQVTALEALAEAQRDSMVVRTARLVDRMQANPPSAAMAALGSWSGEIDESALRDALCKQSADQVDFLLAFARDRRVAAALLTAEQAARLPRLQGEDLMNAMKRP